MLRATQRLVPVMVDCTEKGSHADLMQKYGVGGFPTVVYVDPDGKKLKEMGGREANGIVADIDGLAQKFPGQPSMFANSVRGAIDAAKQPKKPLPVVVYVADEKVDPLKLLVKLMKDVGDRKKKFVWVVEFPRKAALEELGLEKAPAALILDPQADEPAKEPLGRLEVKEGDKPDVLNKAVDEAAKKLKK